jgi:hypothetical protein
LSVLDPPDPPPPRRAKLKLLLTVIEPEVLYLVGFIVGAIDNFRYSTETKAGIFVLKDILAVPAGITAWISE